MGTEATPAADVTTTPTATTTEPATTTTPAATVETTTTTEATTTEPAKTEAAADPSKAEPAKGDETPKPKAPEKYELTKAEGSLLTDAQLKDIETLARSSDLTNEQAQELLVKQEAGIKAYHDTLVNEHKATVNGWIDSVKNDKELGGENFGRTLERAKTVMSTFADESFIKELETSGYGNHPGLLKMLNKVGEKMGENSAFHKAPTTQPTSRRPQDVLYGNKDQK